MNSFEQVESCVSEGDVRLIDMISSTRVTKLEAMRYLGISRATLYRYMANNSDFPKPMRIGGKRGRTYFDLIELEAWIESRKG